MVYPGTATALTAMRNLIDWQHRRTMPPETRPSLPSAAALDEARFLAKASNGTGAISVQNALRILDLFGIHSAPSAFTDTADETVDAARRLGFPVVLKTAAPEILHKTEAGGVEIGLGNTDEVALSYRRIVAACGPQVQVQTQAAPGTEVLLGMTNDLQFGPMVTVGLGGIFTEILGDVVTFQPPIGAHGARRYLERLRGYKLLQGYRGRPKADLGALAAAIERFSVLCASVGPLFSAIDLNPVIAGPSGALAVDALFIPIRNT